MAAVVTDEAKYDLENTLDTHETDKSAHKQNQNTQQLDINLLHRQERHMNEKQLKARHPGLAGQTLGPCLPCMLAKAARSKTRRVALPETRTGQVGECVASDLKLMFQPGTNGEVWLGTAIETASRFALIACTKTKGAFQDHYAHIVKWYETQMGKPYQMWSTDGGTELVNETTRKVNADAGIQHRVTAPHSSIKNPFAERLNRTIGEGVAAMLLTANMSAYWWVQAARYFTYIYNRTPHSALQWKTPYEVFYHRQPHLPNFFPVFGCLAIALDHLRPKSSMFKGKFAAFLGIDSSGRHILMNLTTRRIFTSESVRFVQDKFPLKNTAIERKMTWEQTERNGDLPPTEGMDPDDEDDEQEEQEDLGMTERSGDLPPTEGLDPDDEDDDQEEQEDLVMRPDRGEQDQVVQMDEPSDEKYPDSDGDRVPWEEDQQQESDRRYPTRNREYSRKALENIAHTATFQEGVKGLSNEALAVIANSLLYEVPIPKSYAAAMMSPEAKKWMEAIKKEVEALIRKGTFEEVAVLPGGKTALRCRWLFKVKPATAHEPEIYKARLVVQGFRQKQGMDFQETFAAVARTTSLRVLLALAAAHKTRVTKLDVSNAFLASEMDTDLYVYVPEGYPSNTKFLKLLKALYGLKQSPRLWYKTLVRELESLGYQMTPTDACVFRHKTGKCTLTIVVDDILQATNEEELRTQVEQRLDEKFGIKAFGDVVNMENHVKVSQKQYILQILERFNMHKCKPAATPAKVSQDQNEDMDRQAPAGTPYRQLVGALLYLFHTRPDICAAVVKLSTKLENPTQGDWKAAKRVLRYLSGTLDKGIVYPKEVELKLWAHSDSDWAGCKKTRRSTSGYVVYLGNSPISWKSKMQSVVALSSCEAEYMALVECIKEVLWIRMHLKELGITLEQPVVIGIDNTAAMALAKNPVLHEKSKHIDTRHHFIRQALQAGVVKLQYVNTADNVADILTKNTAKAIFQRLAPKVVSEM
jgi:transposase InsO family protein